jgi:hypothetical protein
MLLDSGIYRNDVPGFLQARLSVVFLPGNCVVASHLFRRSVSKKIRPTLLKNQLFGPIISTRLW